jgi:hypothetical protein
MVHVAILAFEKASFDEVITATGVPVGTIYKMTMWTISESIEAFTFKMLYAAIDTIVANYTFTVTTHPKE